MIVFKKAILPKGFQANAVSCGIKKSGKLDLALFYTQAPARAACLFTTNKVQAAPLKIDKFYLKNNDAFKAIIVNSGNANCFTGNAGMRDVLLTTRSLAKALKIKEKSVLVNSTGIIGKRLAVGKIIKALAQLVQGLSASNINKAKKAILTTDTFAKEITVKISLGGKTVTICGVAKGAGMIAPNMATMLAFIFTDTNISQGALNKALKYAVEDSFNCITVDACMSTNDSVMLLANGAAGNKTITSGSNLDKFSRALHLVCTELAKMIVKDAEGATKFIKIIVKGAKNNSQARNAALSIANSNLFKTAIYGENPNFGRIVSAVGASEAECREDRLKVKLSPLNKKDVFVEVSLGLGRGICTVYTSDLTHEYIKINAEYN